MKLFGSVNAPIYWFQPSSLFKRLQIVTNLCLQFTMYCISFNIVSTVTNFSYVITMTPTNKPYGGHLSNRCTKSRITINKVATNNHTSNGSWCMGIKGEMSGTVCVTFTWDMYIYIWVVYSLCFFCCLFITVTLWYVWCFECTSGNQEEVQACLVTLWLFIISCYSLY